MVRLILMVLFLGAARVGHALDPEQQSLSYVRSGHEKLMARDYQGAFEEYQTALGLVDRSEISSEVMDFFITFGKIIGYDMAGMKAETERAIGQLVLIATSVDDDGAEGAAEDFALYVNGSDVEGYFRDLVNLAPSPGVRKFLMELVDAMVEDDDG
jgi:hypothetical protein